MTPLAAYLLLFVALGIAFIFVHLMAGKLIRPNKPDPAKSTIYECGEPTIGSAWIQFDLRFYVVALLFVIFDVEVAFFFPWAVVFGKANTLAALPAPKSAEDFRQFGERAWELVPPAAQAEHDAQHDNLVNLTEKDLVLRDELRAKRQASGGRLTSPEETRQLEQLESNDRTVQETRQRAQLLSWMALVEIAVFFGVLLVGFAYLWHRGDLAWVRSLAAETTTN
ncbi:MAG: NADH-quinone oxidoreductase subunit A [Gemmataceae bacterium]